MLVQSPLEITQTTAVKLYYPPVEVYVFGETLDKILKITQGKLDLKNYSDYTFGVERGGRNLLPAEEMQ